MLSRVAETVYWTSRYIERAENIARMVEARSQLMYDLPRGALGGWEPLVRITGTESFFRPRGKTLLEKTAVNFLLCDRANPGSAASCLSMARENLRTVRDAFPRAVWEHLNGFVLETQKAAERGLSRNSQQLFTEKVKFGCQAHIGVLTGTLSRNAVMSFMLIGRRLERADMVTRILDGHADASGREHPLAAAAAWRAALQSVSGHHMYRQAFGSAVRGAEVLEFLLHDPEFPRAVFRCMNALKTPLSRLPGPEPVLKLVEGTAARINALRPSTMSPARLSAAMSSLQRSFAGIHGGLEKTYFRPGRPQ